MFRPQDWLLIAVTFSAIAVSVLFPQVGAPFVPFPKYCMMAILFLSFLSLSQADLKHTLQRRTLTIAHLTVTKLVLLPVAVYCLFRLVLPEYALAAMLLSGISTGVVAPFFAGLLNADGALMLVLVVSSSILVPFTLPLLVKLLAGQTLEISLAAMIRLLAAVVFIPLMLAEVLRRSLPRLAAGIERRKFNLSLLLFTMTNLGIFSQYADFFRRTPSVVAAALGVSVLLAAVYFLAGLLYTLRRPLAQRLAVIVSFGIMNNVLVMVFSAEFFSPLEPTVAAVYTIPFYGLILPLRLYQNRHAPSAPAVPPPDPRA